MLVIWHESLSLLFGQFDVIQPLFCKLFQFFPQLFGVLKVSVLCIFYHFVIQLDYNVNIT